MTLCKTLHSSEEPGTWRAQRERTPLSIAVLQHFLSRLKTDGLYLPIPGRVA